MNDLYFLGGVDLEMQTIRRLLDDRRANYVDRQLGWGAKATAYETEIRDAVDGGVVPVLVELDLDLEDEAACHCVIIDHHGERASKDAPTALEQVTERLGITPHEFAKNRWWKLVAANDRGHIAAMRKLDPPATDDEVRRVREADLSAQGVTAQMFNDAKEARSQIRVCAEGRLSIVSIDHDRTGLIAEVLEPFFGGPGYQNLIVHGQSQVAFYGNGRIVLHLSQMVEDPTQSWFGGSLPDAGFWGAASSSLSFDVDAFVLSELSLAD